MKNLITQKSTPFDLLNINILTLLFITCSLCLSEAEDLDPSTKRAVALYGDIEHNKKCDKVMAFLRSSKIVGMSSTQLKELFLKKQWLTEAKASQIGNLAGAVPVDYGNNMVFYLHIYPNIDGWSNYTVWFSIDVQGRDEEMDFQIKDFLLGKVQDKKAVVHQMALSIPGMKQHSDDAKIEFFPKQKKDNNASHPTPTTRPEK